MPPPVLVMPPDVTPSSVIAPLAGELPMAAVPLLTLMLTLPATSRLFSIEPSPPLRSSVVPLAKDASPAPSALPFSMRSVPPVTNVATVPAVP